MDEIKLLRAALRDCLAALTDPEIVKYLRPIHVMAFTNAANSARIALQNTGGIEKQ
jgi:hypothetical protein